MLGDTTGVIQLERMDGTIWTKTHINHISMLSDFDKVNHVTPIRCQSCEARTAMHAGNNKLRLAATFI